jgi:hypothetical protein
VIYEKLFAWLVGCINTCLSESDALSQLVESERRRIEGRFIGVLDIFGFEVGRRRFLPSAVGCSEQSTGVGSGLEVFLVERGALTNVSGRRFLNRTRSSSCASTMPTRRCSSSSSTRCSTQ